MKSLRALAWALFGNDEDGIYGTEKWRIAEFGSDVPPSKLVAVKWWWRNKFHNLCFHVLASPYTTMNVVKSRDENDEWKFCYQKPAEIFHGDKPQYLRAMKPFFISFRTKNHEGYIGKRPINGAPGIALRKTGATSA